MKCFRDSKQRPQRHLHSKQKRIRDKIMGTSGARSCEVFQVTVRTLDFSLSDMGSH